MNVKHPIEQPEQPVPNYENENKPGIGRNAGYLEQERLANGGLVDDPTDSGEPVKNRRSFTNLKGGR